MTRDFNKQRRDGFRPPFDTRSPRRYGEEQPPRPPRSRLNRETVDRAWESGAPQRHADYRTRNSNERPPRTNWRPNQQSTYGSAQNGPRSYSRPQDNRPESRRENSRANRPLEHDPRPRSYNSERRFSDEHRSGQGSYDKRQRPPERNAYAERNFPGNRGRMDAAEHERNFSMGQRQRRAYPSNERPQRRDTRSQHGPDRSRNTSPGYRDRGQFTPPPPAERFEGDYERFNTEKRFSHPTHSPNGHNRQPRAERNSAPATENHVTPLPDGRVLKGSRTSQRKNAQFWTEIAQDTSDLVEQVHTEPADTTDPKENRPPTSESPEAASTTHQDTPTSSQQPQGRSARKPRHARQANPKKITPPHTRATGPKPSQRGFQWPRS